MTKKEQDFLLAGLLIAGGIIALIVLIKQVQDFIDANNWTHILFAFLWLTIAIWMEILTYKDITERKLGWLYGLGQLWKPILGFFALYWTVNQSLASLLYYPWLIYIPFGIFVLVFIFFVILGVKYIICYLKNRKRDTNTIEHL